MFIMSCPIRFRRQPISKMFNECLNQIAENLGLETQLLMRRRWKNQLLHSIKQPDAHAHLPAELLGFRKNVVTEPLIGLLRSHH